MNLKQSDKHQFVIDKLLIFKSLKRVRVWVKSLKISTHKRRKISQKKKKGTRICKWQRSTTNTQIEFYVIGIPFGLHYMHKTSHHPIYTTKTTPRFYKTTSCSYKKKNPKFILNFKKKKILKKRASLHAQSACNEASMLKFDTDIIIYIYIYTII